MSSNETQVTLNGNKIYDAKLTWRQKQTLVSIYWRSYNFGNVTFSDVVGDVGVAFVTLAGHFKALRNKNLIICDKTPINMNFDDKLILTAIGEDIASEFLKKHNLTIHDPLDIIFNKIKSEYEKMSDAKRQESGFYLNTQSTFSKAFKDLITDRNLTEPIISSIALYTELDSQLNLIKSRDIDTYLSLTKSKLNIEIRTGRLSSIALPIMLQGQMPQVELKNLLGDSWSWLGTVDNRQINRYMNEAISLGLIQQHSGLITSLKPNTTDIVSWLSAKTGDTFVNTLNIAPKSSLLVFRESFNYPTMDDLLNPNKSDIDELNWSRNLYEGISDKALYQNYISEAIDILVNKTSVIEEINGRLVPRTIYRNIETAGDMKTTFDTLMRFGNNENNTAAKVLLSVTANPGITIVELYNKVKGEINVQYNSLEEMIIRLANRGLLHIARSAFSKDYKTAKIYSFSHIPFIKPDDKKHTNSSEVNGVLKGMEPWILSSINDYFSDIEEKGYLLDIIKKLNVDRQVYFDDIDSNYGKKMSRKTMMWIHTLVPFVEVNDEFTYMEMQNTSLGNVVVDVLQYSLLTANDSLGIYASIISDMIGKDNNMIEKLENDAIVLKSELAKKI